jgi:hypothetical protein
VTAVKVVYRTGYNFGYSLALWDCDDGVEIVRDAQGRLQDMALTDSSTATNRLRAPG